MTPIPGVMVSRATAVGAPRAAASGVVFALIVQGEKRLSIGERTYAYGPGEYLVASVDVPVSGHYSRASVEEPALGFGLVLRPELIAELVLERWAPARVPGTPAALGVAAADGRLLDAVERMVALIMAPLDRDVLAPLVEREIVWRLLRGPLGESVRQLGLRDSSLGHVGRAVRRITEDVARPFRVEELARECGMSVSAFHRAFHAVTALSPIQFQKQLRLNAARVRLMAGAEDVASVGYEVGYDSPTQFNREYRRQFGLPPGRDAARLRAGGSEGEAVA